MAVATVETDAPASLRRAQSVPSSPGSSRWFPARRGRPRHGGAAGAVVKFRTESPKAGIQWFTGYPVIDFGWLVPLWLGALVVQDAYSKRQFARGTSSSRRC